MRYLPQLVSIREFPNQYILKLSWIDLSTYATLNHYLICKLASMQLQFQLMLEYRFVLQTHLWWYGFDLHLPRILPTHLLMLIQHHCDNGHLVNFLMYLYFIYHLDKVVHTFRTHDPYSIWNTYSFNPTAVHLFTHFNKKGGIGPACIFHCESCFQAMRLI